MSFCGNSPNKDNLRLRLCEFHSPKYRNKHNSFSPLHSVPCFLSGSCWAWVHLTTMADLLTACTISYDLLPPCAITFRTLHTLTPSCLFGKSSRVLHRGQAFGLAFLDVHWYLHFTQLKRSCAASSGVVVPVVGCSLIK